MICPRDGMELKKASRQGVEIDFCPLCRGVWLDRGELDKIIEGAYAVAPGAAPPGAAPGQDPPAVGVWADSIDAAPPITPSPVAPSPVAHAAPYPAQAQPGAQNLADAIVPALGGLIAGLAAGNIGRQQGYGQRGKRRPRGWLEQIFDLD